MMQAVKWVGATLATLSLGTLGFGQSIELLSVGLGGAPSNGACVGTPVVSSDGRFVAFNTRATNLVAVDANGAVQDVHLVDRTTGVIELISVWQGGAQAPHESTVGGVSDDGRYVSFLTNQLNPADVFACERNICVRDRVLGVTTELSPTPLGCFDTRVYHLPPILSGDGRYVGVEYTIDELFWERPRVDVWDRATGAVVWMREGFVNFSNPGGADTYVRSLRLDSTGDWVSYRHDTWLGVTSLRRASVLQPGETTFLSVTAPPYVGNVGLFGGGRYAFYQSSLNFPGVGSELLRRDLQSQQVVRIDETTDQTPVTVYSSSPIQSANAERVALLTSSGNLVQGDTNGVADVFVRDVSSGTTWRWSLSASGTEANGAVLGLAMPADGQSVVFVSEASNLVAGDTNGVADLFVRSGWGLDSSAYCTSATSTGGCTPSISAAGIASASATAGFVVRVDHVDGQKNGLLFYGAVAQATVFGSTGASTMCVASPRQRMGVLNSGGAAGNCDGVLSIDFLQWISQNPGALLTPLSAGQRVHFQAWCRDPAAIDKSLLSDALRVTLGH